MRSWRLGVVLIAAVLALVAAVVPSAASAAAKSCGRVVNPYPGTRYEGSDLRRIRAVEVSCPGARRVARRAHRKALRLPVPSSGVRHYMWKGWQVTGDIRGPTDHYLATRGARRVRWLF